VCVRVCVCEIVILLPTFPGNFVLETCSLHACKKEPAIVLTSYLYVSVLQCFMEPLKKVQVEGFLMFAEPQDLFGNLDELCYVS